MDLQFKGVKYEPTPDIITHAEKRIHPLARFLGVDADTAHAHLELGEAIGNQRTGDIWRAELTIAAGGKQYRAESTKAKLDHAITTVARDVEQELRRAHKKDKSSRRKIGGQIKEWLRFGK